MPAHKNIALPVLLLLWAVSLCLSGTLFSKQAPEPPKGDQASTYTSHLQPEEQGFPVAWMEPSTQQQSASTTLDNILLPFLGSYRLQWHVSTKLAQKSSKPVLGFSSLSEQFRILPNAP